MYQSEVSFSEKLDANEYNTGEATVREIRVLRDGAWQLVGANSEIPRDGDYFAMDRLKVPLLIRRDQGKVRAFHNVCAHRGSRLAAGPGNSDQIKCPYHGWQNGIDGQTRKIPDAKQFPNVMASMTDSMTLVYQIFPLGLKRSRMCVYGFTPRSQRLGWLGKYLAWCLGKSAAWTANRVLQEDAAIFPQVQAGLDAARSPRIFGRIEERIHAFQTNWLQLIKRESRETTD